MYSYSTKVNVLKIRFFCFQKPYFCSQYLSRKVNTEKQTLFTLLKNNRHSTAQ
jgi:hypothetical protein